MGFAHIARFFLHRYGHTEWVTCVAYLHDGRIVSGGMDAKLCVWAASGVRCQDLVGHIGSVSDVSSIGDVAVSAGYDKTVRVWDTR